VNLGRPIVTNGNLLRSCAEVRAAIELSFVMTIGVGRRIHVLDVGPRAEEKGAVFGIILAFASPLV